MDNGTVKTIGIVLVVLGGFVALGGAFIPDMEVGGSASGGSGSNGGTAEGSVSMGFGGLLWVGFGMMAIGLLLAVAGMYAPPSQGEREPPRQSGE